MRPKKPIAAPKEQTPKILEEGENRLPSLPPPRRYKAESVAAIAAKLLQNDDFDAAALRAQNLLDAVEFRTALRAAEYAMTTTKPGLRVEFQDAITRITGHTDVEHARKRYREFCEEVVLRLWAQLEGFEPVEGETSAVVTRGSEGIEIDASEFARKWIAGQKDRGLSEVEIVTWNAIFRASKPDYGSREWKWKPLMQSKIRFAQNK